MRNTHPGFPEIPGESLMDRRTRFFIWKQRNGGKPSNLRNRKRITLKSLQHQIDVLAKRVTELDTRPASKESANGE